MVAAFPERVQGQYEPIAPLRVASFNHAFERRAYVVVLDFALREPDVALRIGELAVALFCNHEAVRGERPFREISLTALVEPAGGIFTDGLEPCEARLATGVGSLDQALVQERCES